MTIKPPTLYLGVDAIRQVQQLMMLATLLPADGRLAELLGLALNTDPGPLARRARPLTDLHPHAVKAWLEENLLNADAADGDQSLAAWQGNSDNMTDAIAELRSAESVIGVRLVATLEPAVEYDQQ